MIHSVYSNKEVFLRELISNASDALDRRRVEAITDKSLLAEGHELEIKIEADKEARLLHFTDSGIGMSRQEVIDNLGTIARSGTKEFLQNLKDSKSAETAELIGLDSESLQNSDKEMSQWFFCYLYLTSPA